MHDRRFRGTHPLSLALPLLVVLGVAVRASAEAPSSIRTEGQLVAYDAQARTLTLKVTRTGTDESADDLAVGRTVVFQVEPEGSVLNRTSVSIHGARGTLDAIPPGATLHVYWRPDTSDPARRVARKIDVVAADEDLDAHGRRP
ncbi:MAG TPA: hypothetical protein VMS55_06015 [Myxococcota bacterium]|nr:hypothetical protein [Myxococcota bacterium]